MNRDSFFAKQDTVVLLAGLIKRLGALLNRQGQVIADGLQRRQEGKLRLLREGRLQPPSMTDWSEYLVDLGQRSLLFWDTLRQRGDNSLDYARAGYPLLLKFDYEVLLDGQDLPRPVNYSLLHILPAEDLMIDDHHPPVIVVDPRGGQGAGIGGFKQDSIIGESLRAGHPTYFVGFSHAPARGQTLADIAHAEARFIELVAQRHPGSGKPIIIGNCQAGWAIMGLAATRPELPGLVVINGAPLSYWAGVSGSNPMRYVGGLFGGAWMTRLGSDLGNGRFDGTWLVSNFEALDPATNLWNKYYNLFANIDSEAPRFLDFERWWGSPTLHNSEEIETIVDDLFIGNRLVGGDPGQRHVDLRRIEAPVVVFCSDGDNITPPQQALNWIADIYPSDLALRDAGRTIVYLKHTSIGHLGIFTSSQVTRREHRQLIDAFAVITALPPGLYELIIDGEETLDGEESYQVHFEHRQIADILAHDRDGKEDEREFALVDRLSRLNSSLYDCCVRPWLSRAINEPTAEALRKAHPFQMSQAVWSSLNPALWWLPAASTAARENRYRVHPQNPLFQWQTLFSLQVEDALDTYRDIRDAIHEACFHGAYGWLAAMMGEKAPKRENEHALQQDRDLSERLQEALPAGGRIEAILRIFLLLGQAAGAHGKASIDRFAEHLRDLFGPSGSLDPVALRETARLQSLLVFAHPAESLRTLPLLLPDDASRKQALELALRSEPMLAHAEGRLGECWRELHAVLGQPLAEPAIRPRQDDEPLPVDNTQTLPATDEVSQAGAWNSLPDAGETAVAPTPCADITSLEPPLAETAPARKSARSKAAARPQAASKAAKTSAEILSGPWKPGRRRTTKPRQEDRPE